jgi:hypothetical protein
VSLFRWACVALGVSLLWLFALVLVFGAWRVVRLIRGREDDEYTA